MVVLLKKASTNLFIKFANSPHLKKQRDKINYVDIFN